MINMEDQLDGFEFVKIEYGRRFYAFNEKGNFIIFWLGNDPSEDLMKARIEAYGSPSHVKTKSFTRQEALRYYHRAEKANQKALREWCERTAIWKDGKLIFREEPRYGERFNPLSKWRYQPRF